MAARSHIISVESAMTGGVRSLRVDVADNARSMVVRQDSVYDTTGDAELAVNLRNVTSQPGNILLIGAVWSDLAGNGQTFTWTTDQEINLQVFARVTGAWPRANSRPGDATQKPVDDGHGNILAATFEVGEDGWLRPDFTQGNDWYVSVRTVEAPRDVAHRYTSFEAVKTILRSNPTRQAGFEANFTDRLNECIASAERKIDAFCGRAFTASVSATRSFPIRTAVVIDTDDLDLSQPVAVAYRRGENTPATTVDTAYYEVRRSFVSYNVGRSVLPDRNRWYPQRGRTLSVTAHFGWPQVPDEVRDYAGRLAAAIFDSDAARAGLIGLEGGLAYGRTPGKDMKLALGHLRKIPVG